MIDNEQITALAREYAEEMHYGDDYFEAENKRLLTWLLLRYCLVEKSKVVKSLIQARALIEGGRRDHDSTKGNLGIGSEQTIYRLFPEIAKEVEE